MAKRFTSTDKWDDPWFRSLEAPYKLFWLFLNDKCDRCGVWKVDIGLACFQMGLNIKIEDAVKEINQEKPRVELLLDGKYILILGFYEYQYGMSPNSLVLKSVLKEASKHKFKDIIVNMVPKYISPLEAPSKLLIRSIEGPEVEVEVEEEVKVKDVLINKPSKRSKEHQAIDLFCDKYKQKTGLEYIPRWGKHIKNIKPIVKILQLHELESSIDKYFESKNGEETKYNLDFFIATVNTWRASNG